MIPVVAASGKCFFCKKYPEDRKKLENGIGATGRGCIMSVARRGSRARLYGNFGWWVHGNPAILPYDKHFYDI